jgi:hypothetical protein
MRLIILFFLSCSLFTKAQKKDTFKEIKTAYVKITSNKESYLQKNVDVDEFSTEGGYATAYLQNGEVKLIEVGSAFETGKSFLNLYYKQNELFFVLQTEHRYNRPFYYDAEAAQENNDSEAFDESKTIITENRYYFNRGELIRWINEDGDIKKMEDDTQLKNILTLETTIKKKLKDE